ncbi:PKD domain-containing protein [Myroides sp. N17-2]|uniref:PKD domain-containing protein n=1 Tax=Myroides sp. N17-2 TaxID=2030799 RepID=UPI000EFA966C|nr:PKD domain-containing protein [Myroides sp. N17-2]
MKKSLIRVSTFLLFGITLITGTLFIGCSSDSNETTEIIDPPAEIKYNFSDITKVFDFRPAPGQFINELPKYVKGDTQEVMNEKALKAISGNKLSMVSLGGYGGYIVVGFDQTIQNIDGQRDFKVLGNAFWADANPNPSASKRGGSCEPGIIMVAYDKNKNGMPDDDEWYEIAGSEYYKVETNKNYKITYHKPDPSKAAVKDPNNNWATDIEYFKWEDNTGDKGWKTKNSFHHQNYYPEWYVENEVSFSGTKLANNAKDESGKGSYWVLYSYPWGYADNAPNNDDESAIDINWAVDKDGNKVHLTGIDFVKIYTGINQESGWLGEVSTEVVGIVDLHKAKIKIPTRK